MKSDSKIKAIRESVRRMVAEADSATFRTARRAHALQEWEDVQQGDGVVDPMVGRGDRR